MKTAALLFVALVTAAGCASAAAAHTFQPMTSCPAGTKPAIVGGNFKCLRVGQACASKYSPAYSKFGFKCVAGHLRKRTAVPPRPKPAPAPAPPQPIAAKVLADKAGVSSRYSSIGSTFAGYGVVLRNVSPDEDALRVSVLANVLDAAGRILASDSQDIVGIPAGATYYVGGDVIYSSATPAVSLETSVQVGGRHSKSIGALPPIANLRWTSGSSGAEVDGEFSNPYTRTMSDLARIGVVCFDASGNVIGGDRTYPPAQLPPGGRAGFSVE